MTKLTTERLEQYAHDKHMCNINDEIREMAQKLLEYEQAAKNPVAWVVGDEEIAEFKNGREVCVMRDCDDEQLDYLPLYAAPVLPKQPDVTLTNEGDITKIIKAAEKLVRCKGRYHSEQNYRALAALFGVTVPDLPPLPTDEAPEQPVIPEQTERERIRREHAEWSDATFGNVGPVGPLKHLSKEALEAAADPDDLLEWADMQFLLWDAQRRMGIPDDFITIAMAEKLEINKKRQWPEPKDGEPRLHINTQSAQPESEIPFGDVEPIEVTDDMVYAFHNRLSDGSLTSDEFTDIKQGLCAALMNIPLPTQPVIQRELRSFVTDSDIAALHRFAECCDDPESGGHDLEKEQVQRLEKVGALQRSGRISYITDFGDYLISATAPVNAQQNEPQNIPENIPAQPVSEPYKLEIDMDDADHFSITHLHEIIYGKELIWPEAKLLARFMLDVKQRVSEAPAQESE